MSGLTTRIHNLATQIKELFHEIHGDQLPQEVNHAVQTLQAEAGKVVAAEQKAEHVFGDQPDANHQPVPEGDAPAPKTAQ